MRRRWRILIGVAVVLAVLLTLNTIAVDNETKSAGVTVTDGRILHLPGGELQVAETGPTKKGPEGAPIVLVHCYSCSLHWWDRMVPILARHHRVIRVDLLGFGGSEKPASGYEIEDQAALLAQALNELHVEGAVVVGHSMGFDVTTALAEQSSQLVDRAVDIDEPPAPEFADLNFLAQIGYVPVLGQAIWRLTPDFVVKDGYGQAFAPGYDVSSGFPNPDQVVDDFRAMTYTSYDQAGARTEDFEAAIPLDTRITNSAIPLLVIFGSEDQLADDPEAAAHAYDDVPGVRTSIIDGAGHSPNVERPEETARLVLEFTAEAGDEAEVPQPPRGKSKGNGKKERGGNGRGAEKRGQPKAKDSGGKGPDKDKQSGAKGDAKGKQKGGLSASGSKKGG